ncbi:MAG TPA: histidinol dehydrogenase [Smithellaceae bacterium]|nr:histidinol dehydrogenase [Smithellaceae bacterium]
MKIFSADAPDFADFFRKLRSRGAAFEPDLLATVAEIIRDVTLRGDDAVFEYTKKFDGHLLAADTVEASGEERRNAAAAVDATDRDILQLAASRIEAYHRHQIAGDWSMTDPEGARLGQRVLPLSRIGIYAPGGKAFYPSTLLMAAIPAKLAGVGEIIVVTPSKDGRLAPLLAAAADIAGVDRIFKIGGAQAVAALAYGTRCVPQVDKIVGPGNAYVAAAKKLVFGQVAIDMIAGPSEVVIIADESADPAFAAADLLAQAEHDEMAAAVLFTPSEELARRVAAEIGNQTRRLPKKGIIEKSLAAYGAIILTRDLAQAVALSNRFAPEHLELMTADPEALLGAVTNAGSVFLGHYTPEALGDYIAGTNHILPTEGTARFSSPLGVYDFCKRMSVLSFPKAAFDTLAARTERFARIEGLDAHADSVRVRMRRDSEDA